MKKRLVWVALCALMIVGLMPLTALAADVFPADGYNDHDYTAIRSFLEQETEGVKNGTRVSGGSYNPDDPTTWAVSWVPQSGESYVYGINWNDKGLAGALDVSDCYYLEALYVRSGSLSSIDVTGCVRLVNFNCASNDLASLNLSDNVCLTWLQCNDNRLEALNTSAAADNLLYLYCFNNDILSLNVSTNTGLTELNCESNQIETLDLSGFNSLEYLNCVSNNLTAIDLTGCGHLLEIDCIFNSLTDIDVSDCTLLERFSCSANMIDTLDVSANTALISLACAVNNLSALDVSTLTQLLWLDCDDNGIGSMDISHNTQLVSLSINNNQVSEIDPSHNPDLGMLYCDNNPLTAIDASANTDMKYFSCVYCPATQIDVNMFGAPISLAAGEGGTVGLTADYGAGITAFATAASGGSFWNWTNAADAPFSATAETALTKGIAYDLTANFLRLVPSVPDRKIYTDGMIDLVPTVAGGSFSFDTASLSRSGNTFTPLKAGTVLVSYTLAGKSASVLITVLQKLEVGTSAPGGKVYTGGRITLTPNIEGGEWTFDSAFFSREGGTFTALKPGTSTITYTAGGQTVRYDITIETSELPSTGQDMMEVWALIGAAAVVCAAGVLLRHRLAMQK